MAAPRSTFSQHSIQDLRAFRVVVSLFVVAIAGVRHGLPPEETSQVAAVTARDVAVGHHQIVPAVVVQIEEV